MPITHEQLDRLARRACADDTAALDEVQAIIAEHLGYKEHPSLVATSGNEAWTVFISPDGEEVAGYDLPNWPRSISAAFELSEKVFVMDRSLQFAEALLKLRRITEPDSREALAFWCACATPLHRSLAFLYAMITPTPVIPAASEVSR